jgi:hypothetical protein
MLKPMSLQKIAALRIKKKVDVDPDIEYCKGFEEKCAAQGLDPLRVIEIAKLLELRL